MEQKTYSVRIEEISDEGRNGVDYAIVSKGQYDDIMAIMSVKNDDYKPMHINEMFFGS